MSYQVQVRRAVSADAALLAELGARTFHDAYGSANRPDRIEGYVASTYHETAQRMEIADPANGVLIAEVDGNAVGFAMLAEEAILSQEEGAAGTTRLRLSRLYVDQPFQSQGIGAALMRRGIEEARGAGHDTLWLGVWEHNPAAVDFYRRWGFEVVGEETFMLGGDLQRDLVMRLRL